MAVQEMQKRRLLVLNLTYPVKLAELSYKTVRVDESQRRQTTEIYRIHVTQNEARKSRFGICAWEGQPVYSERQ